MNVKIKIRFENNRQINVISAQNIGLSHSDLGKNNEERVFTSEGKVGNTYLTCMISMEK